MQKITSRSEKYDACSVQRMRDDMKKEMKFTRNTQKKVTLSSDSDLFHSNQAENKMMCMRFIFLSSGGFIFAVQQIRAHTLHMCTHCTRVAKFVCHSVSFTNEKNNTEQVIADMRRITDASSIEKCAE